MLILETFLLVLVLPVFSVAVESLIIYKLCVFIKQERKKTREERLRLETERKYKILETNVLTTLGFPNWNVAPYYDECVTVKTRQDLENYDVEIFF